MKGYSDEIIFEAVSKGKEYGYINDNLYAETFINNNSKYSKLVLKSKLINKGIEKSIIDENLKNLVFEDDEVELCQKYAEKYLKTKKIQSQSDKQKLFASLARRGFNYDVIKKATKNIIEYEFD